jgi:hypothetical protein
MQEKDVAPYQVMLRFDHVTPPDPVVGIISINTAPLCDYFYRFFIAELLVTKLPQYCIYP